MASMNKVFLIGNLGKDPETRQAGGNTVCNFSVATSEKWTKDGQTNERTEWHRIQAWGKLAEVCAQYLKKGSQVCVEGKIQTREYEKDGEKRYATEIVAANVTFLGGREGGSGGAQRSSGGSSSRSQASSGNDDIPF